MYLKNASKQAELWEAITQTGILIKGIQKTQQQMQKEMP